MASINEKLNYINETKSLIKDKLNDLGSEIDNETTFREYTEKIENLYEEWPKVTDENIDITLNDTKKGKMELILKGNTFQSDTPTPSSPVDINIVSGENTINICGKNLCSDYTNGTSTSKYEHALKVKANLKPNTFYEISFIDSSTGNYYYRNETVVDQYSSYTITSDGQRQYWCFSTKDNITPDQDGEYVIFKNNQVQTNAPQFDEVDIREVEQLTTDSFDYELYQSQIYPIFLGDIELCKVGDYQDYFYKDSDKWYLHKEIKKVVLDGSENWNSASSVVSGTSRFYYDNNEILNPGSTNTPLSNMFKSLTWMKIYSQDTTTRYGVAVWDDASHQGRLIIRIDNTLANSVASFKTWLGTNKPTVYYVLATSTNIQITDTTLVNQLDVLEQAISYNNQTNISQTNDNLPFIISASALLKNSN